MSFSVSNKKARHSYSTNDDENSSTSTERGGGDAEIDCLTSSPKTDGIVFHRGLEALAKLDQLEIRLGSQRKWENHDIPTTACSDDKAVVVPPSPGNNNEIVYRVIYLNGSTKAVQELKVQFGAKQKPTYSLTDLPSLTHSTNYHCPSVIVGRKLYAMGINVNARPHTCKYEVLDLDNLKAGWDVRPIPFKIDMGAYRSGNHEAVVVGNRYIFNVYYYKYLENPEYVNFASYDTWSETWNTKIQQQPEGNIFRNGFSVTAIDVPGEGSYVVIAGGDAFNGDRPDEDVLRDFKKDHPCACDRDGSFSSIEAYHIESDTWKRIAKIPVYPYHPSFLCVSTLGNRYILFAVFGSTRTILFDWITKEWFELPSLQRPRNSRKGVFIPGNVNKWFVSYDGKSFSLNIAPGLSWAQERLLLLCFHGKGQKKGSNKICYLDGLEKGILANILSYLMIPFLEEVNCKGSIFFKS